MCGGHARSLAGSGCGFLGSSLINTGQMYAALLCPRPSLISRMNSYNEVWIFHPNGSVRSLFGAEGKHKEESRSSAGAFKKVTNGSTKNKQSGVQTAGRFNSFIFFHCANSSHLHMLRVEREGGGVRVCECVCVRWAGGVSGIRPSLSGLLYNRAGGAAHCARLSSRPPQPP